MKDKKITLEDRLVPPQTNTKGRTERFILDMIRCLWQIQNNIRGPIGTYTLLHRLYPEFKTGDSLLVLDLKGFYHESFGWFNNSPSLNYYYYTEGLEFLRDKSVIIEDVSGDLKEHLIIRYKGKINYPLCVTEVRDVRSQERRKLNTIETPDDFHRLFLSLNTYQWDQRRIKEKKNTFSPDFIFLPNPELLYDFTEVLSYFLSGPVSKKIRKRIEQYYAHGEN